MPGTIQLPDDAATLSRVRAASLFEPEDYCRRLEKREVFPEAGEAPLEVDLGCGDGGFLIDLAAEHPDRRFLGIERLLGRARKVARKAARRGVHNVKSLRIEIGYAVGYLLPVAGVSRVHLMFPDPWPKQRHLKHRLVTPTFCADVHRVLEPGGEWLFKTDHPDLFGEVVALIRESGWFDELAWPDAAFVHPLTDFERQWLGVGREIQRARFVRRDRPSVRSPRAGSAPEDRVGEG